MSIGRIQVQIDNGPVRSSIGFGSISELARDNAQKCQQAALNAAAQISAEGDSLSRVESGISIADIAVNYFAEISVTGELQFKFVDPPAISWHFDTRM